jgi:hypothetical protein
VFAGKNSAGVAEGEGLSESVAVILDRAFFAGSTCSLWTSGISPRGCFSHEEQKISKPVTRAMPIWRRRKAIRGGTLIVDPWLAQDQTAL